MRIPQDMGGAIVAVPVGLDPKTDGAIIGGKTVVQNGRVRQLDEQNLSEKIQSITEKLWDSMPQGDFAGRTVDELSPLSLPLWDS